MPVTKRTAKTWSHCRRCGAVITPKRDAIELVPAFGWVHAYCTPTPPPTLTPAEHRDRLRQVDHLRDVSDLPAMLGGMPSDRDLLAYAGADPDLTVAGTPRDTLVAIYRASWAVTHDRSATLRIVLAAYRELTDAGLVVREVDRGPGPVP